MFPSIKESLPTTYHRHEPGVTDDTSEQSGRAEATLQTGGPSPVSSEPPYEDRTGRWNKLTRWISQTIDPRLALALLLLASLLFRVLYINVPDTPKIFDETYYVNAARVIVGIHVPPALPYADQQAGIDPNHEHPPLGKVMIAASMRVFGDDPFGWRFMSILSGMLSILLLYAIVRAAGGDEWLAVLAATLFSFDNLVLVQSRIATLDILIVVFFLLGAWAALRRWPLLAGMAVALATLVKLTGLYALIAVLLLEAGLGFWEWRRTRRLPLSNLQAAGMIVVSYVVVFFAGLWVLDLAVTTFHTPWEHLQFMTKYGLSLSRPSGPVNQESYPWQWLINDVQESYFIINSVIRVTGQVAVTRPQISFRGAMNPIIIGAFPLGFAYSLWRMWRLKDRLSLWVVVWVIGVYLPFYPLSMVEHRISYLFYFLPTLPAVAVSLAQLLRQGGLPRTVMWGYLVMVLIGFLGYFPYRHVPL